MQASGVMHLHKVSRPQPYLKRLHAGCAQRQQQTRTFSSKKWMEILFRSQKQPTAAQW